MSRRIGIFESLQETQRIEESKLPARMVRDYEKRAAAERRGGGQIEINHRLPTVAVVTSSGEQFFFQEHEAQKLLDDVPENISAEDFILAQAQGW